MSHQFKPGDLALIVGGESPNLGLCVELIYKISNRELFLSPDGKLVGRYFGPGGWVVWGQEVKANSLEIGWVNVGGLAPVSDKNLIPLRGELAPEQQKTKEAEPCL